MITIVSGLPRSGTSLMMQMLAAGGMPILSDGERRADVDNPRGYLEWERIKQLPKDPGCILEAEGKAVKVISRLLLSLPERHEYRVIFMQRPLPEVLASQEVMLRNRGTATPGTANAAMAAAFAGIATVEFIDCKSQIGSGALPVSLLPSAGLALRPREASGKAVERLAQALRDLPIPVIGHIADGRLVLDLRCLEDEAGFVEQLTGLKPL